MTLLRDPSADRRPEVAVVRKPIVDGRHHVVGYELLFGDDGRLLDPARDAQATSALLVDAFGEIGLDELSGAHPAWVSIARDFLVDIGTPPFRPDRAVLQIAAYRAQDDLLTVLQAVGRSGYTLALVGYEGQPEVEALLALCSLVKVEVTGREEAELAELIAAPRAHGALLVASGVATPEDLARCQALGFTYYQGDFFAKPRLVRHRGVATGGLGSLRALDELNRDDLSFEELEGLVASDVGLSLKLLRYVNSAFFALPRTVASVREALAMLGVRVVRRWATVMVLAAIPSAPSELVALALQRARMCEVLAAAASPHDREAMFTVGLFSVADGLLDLPMTEVLNSLPFSEEIRTALLTHEGPKGELLAAVLAYERGEFPTLPDGAHGVSLRGAYRQALDWADQAERSLA